MPAIHFRPQGWRARRGEEFNETGVVAVAAALGLVLGSENEGARVLVGFDTRSDSERYAMIAGEIIASYGLDVYVSEGPCPAPAVEWNVATDAGCSLGVMVSGDDLGFGFNGILVCGPDGGAPSASFIKSVDKLIATGSSEARAPVKRRNLIEPFLEDLVRTFEPQIKGGMRPKILVDAMYGTAGTVVRRLLQHLGCEVVEMRAGKPRDWESTRPQAVEPWLSPARHRVVDDGCDFGISFDCLCRRLALIDSEGKVVSEHLVGPMVLEHLVRGCGYHGRVVRTTACSVRLEREAERLGLECSMVAVGFTGLYSEMRDGNVCLAAEELGGICVPAHLMSRDAIYSCLCVISRMSATDQDLERLVHRCEDEVGLLEYGREDIEMDSARIQMLRNLLPGLNPHDLAGRVPSEVSHADGLRVSFDDGAWAMLRPSRTQPLVRAYAEAPTTDERDQLLKAVAVLADGGIEA